MSDKGGYHVNQKLPNFSNKQYIVLWYIIMMNEYTYRGSTLVVLPSFAVGSTPKGRFFCSSRGEFFRFGKEAGGHLSGKGIY